MAEALKMKEESIRGGEGTNGGASAALDKLGEHPRRLRQYIHDVRAEMGKVSWPSWNDVRSTTVVVIVTVAFFGVYFLIADTLVGRAIGWLIDYGRSH
jgi:preprotein translocase subunit SecE